MFAAKFRREWVISFFPDGLSNNERVPKFQEEGRGRLNQAGLSLSLSPSLENLSRMHKLGILAGLMPIMQISARPTNKSNTVNNGESASWSIVEENRERLAV